MNRATKLALAVALPAAAIAAVGQSASAATPPIEPPSPDIGVLIPPDFVMLSDDTGTMTVGIPDTWIEVETAPDDGLPFIEAAPDRQVFTDTFDVPGVSYRVVPFNPDTEAEARSWGIISGCDNESVRDYTDGTFAGTQLVFTKCGRDDRAEFHVVAANPGNQALTAVLQIQITGVNQNPILEGILATFNTTGAVRESTTTAPGSSIPTTRCESWRRGGRCFIPPPSAANPPPSAAFPRPSGEVPDDWPALIDSTGALGLSVPRTWTATDVSRGVNDDGSPQPVISATTDFASFVPPMGAEDTYSVPGVIFYAVPMEAITPARLETSAFKEDCTAGPIQTYDDGAYVGYIRSFNSCGGTHSRVVELVANPRIGSVTVVLLVQLTGEPDDEATLDGLLSAFVDYSGFDDVLSGIFTAPTTTATVAAPTTTDAGQAPTTSAHVKDPLVAIQQLVQNQLGLTITTEQASCLLDHASDLDPTSEATTLVNLEDCGVDMLDIPSG